MFEVYDTRESVKYDIFPNSTESELTLSHFIVEERHARVKTRAWT